MTYDYEQFICVHDASIRSSASSFRDGVFGGAFESYERIATDLNRKDRTVKTPLERCTLWLLGVDAFSSQAVCVGLSPSPSFSRLWLQEIFCPSKRFFCLKRPWQLELLLTRLRDFMPYLLAKVSAELLLVLFIFFIVYRKFNNDDVPNIDNRYNIFYLMRWY